MPHLTPKGADVMMCFGIDVGKLRAARAPLCRECLDWNERCAHLVGNLGRAFLTRIEELGWAKRDRRTRILTFSHEGERAFNAFILNFSAEVGALSSA